MTAQTRGTTYVGVGVPDSCMVLVLLRVVVLALVSWADGVRLRRWPLLSGPPPRRPGPRRPAPLGSGRRGRGPGDLERDETRGPGRGRGPRSSDLDLLGLLEEFG